MIDFKAFSGRGAPPEDAAPISWAPWLTARRLTFFVIAWLSVFAVGSLLISNPFQAETAAGVTPDYFHVMYMHGLLIGMVGLLALLTLAVMKVRSLHVRMWIVGGVAVATVLAAVGGVFDTKIPGAEVPMWTQILSFFALDEILIALAWGLFSEWRRGMPNTRTLSYATAVIASVSMLFSAAMGHLAGWIMEFGEYPAFITSFRQSAGFDSQDGFVGALVGSHSHEMAVAAMGLTALIAIQFLGYSTVTGAAKLFARIGVAMIGAGILVVSVIYIAGTVSQYAPPSVFDGRIPGDDVVSGVLVMGGGIVALLAVVNLRTLLQRPVSLATAWAFVLSVATVAAAGYSVELHESFFGAGDQTAAGAGNDAIFTWFHQDVGLFLLPTIVLVMLAVQLLIGRKDSGWIGWAAAAGTTFV
ncbi:MAG TPA: hypothetical protein VEU76_08720, partial [Candidatus Udaeobacter sp.]|nr:hypothetical protein [Candidatus Udaeobacter sp.]